LSGKSVHSQYLEKRSQDILRRKPGKGYSDAGSIAKYYMGSCLKGGFPTQTFANYPAHALKNLKGMSEAN
jgi:hypothetical protein